MPTQRGTNTGSVFRNIDLWTVIIYLVMIAAGLASIYAACYDFNPSSIFSFDEFPGKQLAWIGLSGILILVVLVTNSRMFETYAYPIYVLMIIVLAATIVIAPDIKGSHSWLVIGPIRFQPAEFAKIATSLALAKLFSSYNFHLNDRPINYVKTLSIIILPILLILAQNETGSALTFLALFLVLYREGMSGLVLFSALYSAVIFIVGIKYADTTVQGMPGGEFAVMLIILYVAVGLAFNYSKRIVVAVNLFFGALGISIFFLVLQLLAVTVPAKPILLCCLAAATIYICVEAIRQRCPKLYTAAVGVVFGVILLFSAGVAFNLLQPHQQLRIRVTLGMVDDPRGSGYNVNQSKIAVGSGGFWGKGFLHGTQTKLKYVPEPHTDFIFCTIGEEEGFVGAAAVTLLFMILILRIIKIAERQPTIFGRVYAYCVASYLLIHFFINIGMVTGLCPVIGIPLPFFSYGGSSLWGFTIMLFILLKIDATRKNIMVY